MTAPTPDDIRKIAGARAFGEPLIQNNLRGLVAEVLVHAALGDAWTWCSGDWSGWDLEHREDGTRVEVKQSAAKQTWAPGKKPPSSRFDIRARTGHWDGPVWHPAPGRQAHIYVFAHHPIVDESADHRDPEQWRFYVVPAERLPLTGKTIGLIGVASLAAPVSWDLLSTTVENERLRRMNLAWCAAP